MSFSFYVYYKVTEHRSGALRTAVLDLFDAVAAASGVQGRLLCRRDRPDTWMEVYEPVTDASAFEALLDAQVQRLAFGELLGAGSPRITEIFRPL